jgi:UDP-N-acetyl-D-mannosaminuronic acid dehydrogenase
MDIKTKKISVIGLGYIGLPTAALLAINGYSVAGVDVNDHAVKTINQGKIHFIEPDLDAFVKSAVTAGRFRAFTKPQPSDVYMICVPTPLSEIDGILQPNLDYVLAAIESILPLVKSTDLIILESTSPVGTTEQIQNLFIEAEVDVDEVCIAYCPERVMPGKIMTELLENDRIVGGITSKATKIAADFYRTFVRGKVLETNAKTAEMCKLTENSFRDVNIAFANELSLICDKEGINVCDLISLANKHPRVNILQPGAGVGGHCIAVDPWFIVARDEVNSRLIKTAREINDYKTDWVIEKIKSRASAIFDQKGVKPKIACLGLAFKADIDDLRGSPALKIAITLIYQGYEVVAIEPNIERHTVIELEELDNVLNQDIVLAVMVKHKEFLEQSIREKLTSLSALDFCGALA